MDVSRIQNNRFKKGLSKCRINPLINSKKCLQKRCSTMQRIQKAAGRALGTLVEIITFYSLKSWGLEMNVAIEKAFCIKTRTKYIEK